MTTRHCHEVLGDDGIGKCSVPMWAGGVPAGFCDRPAFGDPIPCTEGRIFNTGTMRMQRVDGRYDGFVPGLACPSHGGPRTRVFIDGNQYCAVSRDFTNLQESPAGFGDTPDKARASLAGCLSLMESRGAGGK